MMSEDKMAGARGRVLRRCAAGVAVVAVPVVLMSAVTVTPAWAEDAPHGQTAAGGGPSPTTPIDAFSDHWQQYHKGKDFTQEPKTIESDPGHYAQIHEEMAGHMLGQ